MPNRPRGLSLLEAFQWHMPGEPPDVGCWEWSSARVEDGYGVLSFGGKDLRAHVVAYRLFVGEVPDGLLIRHDCDNPPCVSPYHLLDGSVLDNVRDRVERQRGARGERVNSARLTERRVLMIRDLYTTGHTRYELAKVFGVDWDTVNSIVRHETWTHL